MRPKLPDSNILSNSHSVILNQLAMFAYSFDVFRYVNSTNVNKLSYFRQGKGLGRFLKHVSH